ncbi:MAG: class I SAM-dependent methyltransferase [Haloarculaceae archaeon]
MTREVRAWWEEVAGGFQADIDLDVGVNWLGFGDGDLRVLGDVAGADVLELGCGGGQCSVALAERGADVTGVDLSGAQLDYARGLAAERGVGVAFLQGDVTALPVADASFDVAFNAWVFQWVPDLEAAFAEASRVLRPGGRFVFSMPHPFYGVVDPESHEVVESYLDSGRRVSSHEGVEADEVLYRHTVGEVYDALVAAGLEVERLLEPGTADPDDHEEGPWGVMQPELMAKVPTTLLVEAREPG